MRFILGVVLSAAALFGWGYLYWGVSPMPNDIFKGFVDGEAAQAIPNGGQPGFLGGDPERMALSGLNDAIQSSGVYLYPKPPKNMSDEGAVAVWEEKHRQGPVLRLFYNKEGIEPNTQDMMVMGFLHSLLITFLCGLITLAAAPKAYINRVMLLFWVGVLVAVWADGGNKVWWYYPWDYTFLEMGYKVVGGILVALILAAFVRPNPEMN